MTNEPKPPAERDYPPLPKPAFCEFETGRADVIDDGYSAAQMHAYYDLGREAGARDHESSYSSKELAAMVLSDCGHSSNYEPLLNRVAGRIDRHVERLLTAQRAALAASPAAQAAPAAVAVPVYQARVRGTETGWSDVNINGYWAAQAMRTMEARILYTHPAPQQAAPATEQLRKFYGVTSDAELIEAQANHIERLQAKLPAAPSFAPTRVREG